MTGFDVSDNGAVLSIAVRPLQLFTFALKGWRGEGEGAEQGGAAAPARGVDALDLHLFFPRYYGHIDLQVRL